ncbi:MAG: hypothetical protein OEZ10_13195 [Gammaproteobacteria bacterium]|nr:hypothetical protein [Gammaproteobacteria bacterium]
MRTRLVFVYNADSGLFNAAIDTAHKMLSPNTYSCQLCRLSHGYFSERPQWREFVEWLPADCEFLHRDEAKEKYAISAELPAVLKWSDGSLSICLPATALRQCNTLDELRARLSECCLSE